MIFVLLTLTVMVPLLLLVVLIANETYHTVRLPVLLLACGWGIISFWLARVIEQAMMQVVGMDFHTATILVAPAVEESLRGVAIIIMYAFVLVRYSGDGLLYGFAIGSAFAIMENIVYLTATPEDLLLGEAVARTVSTGLLHASLAGLVGAYIATAVYYPRRSALVWGLALLSLAVGCHAVYNTVLWLEQGRLITVTGVSIGVFLLLAVFGVQRLNDRLEANRVRHDLHDTLASTQVMILRDQVRLLDRLRESRAQLGEAEAEKLLAFFTLEGQMALYDGKLTAAQRSVAARVIQRERSILEGRALLLRSQLAPASRDWLDRAKAESG